MGFLLSILLLTSELFSIIKIGTGLKCFSSANTECIHLLKHLADSKNSLPEPELEKIRINVTSCMKSKIGKSESICKEKNAKCSQFTIKFKDGSETTVRSCEPSVATFCKGFRLGLLVFHQNHVDHVTQCAYCDTDGCNSEQEDKDLYCYRTVPETLCMMKITALYKSKKGFGGNKNQLENEALNCLRREHNDEYISCKNPTSVCSKLSLKFKDGKQAFFTYCDTIRNGELINCQTLMKDDIDLNGLADAKCDYCSVSGCNSSPNNISHLENSPYSEDKTLVCPQTNFQDLCIPELSKLDQAKELEKYNLYDYTSDALNCYKLKKRENYELCSKEKTQCSRLTLKFNDGTKTSIKACDTDRDSICEYYKEKTTKYFPYAISSAQCDYCTGDSCNDVEELAEPVEQVSNLSCFETELDSMCERELTNWHHHSSLESDALKCLKRKNEVNHKRCKAPNSVCSKLSLQCKYLQRDIHCQKSQLIKFSVVKDGTETEFNFCDSRSTCKTYKEYLDEEIKDELVHAQCDNCSENSCNSKLEKTVFRQPEQKEPEEKKGLQCYHSDLDSCMEKIADKYAFMSCASRAQIKQKKDCELCVTNIYTKIDNQKMEIVSCGSERLCRNSTDINKALKYTSGNKLKSIICIPCKYDLCNILQKQGLGKNEIGNQVESNFIVIIFIFLLVCFII